MNHWLVKQEPDDYPFTQLVRDGTTDWTGVRNYQARNFLRAMAVGDPVLYYHSGREKSVVGLAEVSRAAFPDPTAEGEKGEWIAVELRAGRELGRAVALAELKAEPELKELLFLRQSRLSVSPVSREEFGKVLQLAAESEEGDEG